MAEQIFSRTTLIHYVKTKLNPNKARLYRNGQRARNCSTGIIRQIRLDDGEVVDLATRSDGRVGAVYVRVSKPKQADYKNQGDSFSPDFQIWNCAMYFIARGEAFIVFTDAGLSGADPIDNPEIMRSMWAARAKNYGSVFTRILLKDHTANYTSSQLAGMRRYRDDKVNRLRNGGLLEMPFTKEEDAALADQSGKQMQVDYRPGLTVLIEELRKIHTVAVIDMSRLARSQFLFQVLTEMFGAQKVEVVGVTQDIDLFHRQNGHNDSSDDDEFNFSSDQEMGKTVGTFFLTLIAQYRVNEALLGSMRGIVQMLKDGCPHSKTPFWIKRIKPAQRKRSSGHLTDDGLIHEDDDLFGEKDAVVAEGKEIARVLVEQIEETDDAPDFVADLPLHLKTNFVYVDPDMLSILEKMIEWYLDEDEEVFGLGAVAERLNAEGYQDKYGHPKGHKDWSLWRSSDVGDALENMALIGIQPVFGLDWKVFPSILIRKDIDGKPILGADGRPQADRAKYERIQSVRAARASENTGAGRPTEDLGGYLLTGLIRCHCGRLLSRVPNPAKNGKDYYSCRATKAERDAEPDVLHVSLRRDSAEQFFEGMVKHSRKTLLSLAASRDRNDDQYQEILRLRTELDQLDTEIVSVREKKQIEAETVVQNIIHIDPGHPRFLEQVESMLGSLMLEYQDRKNNMSEQIRRAISEIHRPIPGDAEGTIEERLDRWETMTIPQKRLTLKSVIKEMLLRGEPPNEFIQIFSHDEDIPVTVRLDTEVRHRRQGDYYLRRFPSMEKWAVQVMSNTLTLAEAREASATR